MRIVGREGHLRHLSGGGDELDLLNDIALLQNFVVLGHASRERTAGSDFGRHKELCKLRVRANGGEDFTKDRRVVSERSEVDEV